MSVSADIPLTWRRQLRVDQLTYLSPGWCHNQCINWPICSLVPVNVSADLPITWRRQLRVDQLTYLSPGWCHNQCINWPICSLANVPVNVSADLPITYRRQLRVDQLTYLSPGWYPFGCLWAVRRSSRLDRSCRLSQSWVVGVQRCSSQLKKSQAHGSTTINQSSYRNSISWSL